MFTTRQQAILYLETRCYVSMGQWLKDWLKLVGMTQADLARRMGRPKKTINEIIKGKAHMTAETAIQIEYALHISASALLRWQSEEELKAARQKLASEDGLSIRR